MKTKRFQILAGVLVFLALTKQISNELNAKIPASFKKTFQSSNGMNAVPCQNIDITSAQSGAVLTKFGSKYLAVNIGKGGKHVDLVDANLKQEEGISNFTKPTMPTGEVVIFDELVLLYGHAAAGTSPKAIDWSRSLPKAIANGEIEIRTGSKVVLSIPVMRLQEAQNNVDKTAGLKLIEPGYLLDNKNFQITLKMPEQFSDTDDHFVRLAFNGLVTSLTA